MANIDSKYDSFIHFTVKFNSRDYSISFFSGIFNSKNYSITFFPGKFDSKIDTKFEFFLYQLSKIFIQQNQVNNANSAFIFMINLLIIQDCRSGSVGWVGQLVRLFRLIWWSRWSWLSMWSRCSRSSGWSTWSRLTMWSGYWSWNFQLKMHRGCRVAEVVRRHGRPPPKSLDLDENFKPEYTLFCRDLHTFCRSLGKKSAFLGKNSASWAGSALLHGIYCIFY